MITKLCTDLYLLTHSICQVINCTLFIAFFIISWCILARIKVVEKDTCKKLIAIDQIKA